LYAVELALCAVELALYAVESVFYAVECTVKCSFNHNNSIVTAITTRIGKLCDLSHAFCEELILV